MSPRQQQKRMMRNTTMTATTSTARMTMTAIHHIEAPDCARLVLSGADKTTNRQKIILSIKMYYINNFNNY